jgi:hypothetical protein
MEARFPSTGSREHGRSGASNRRRIIIVGAAGRDFHNFNMVFRDDPGVEVVAFTAAQIPLSPAAATRRCSPVRSIPMGFRSPTRQGSKSCVARIRHGKSSSPTATCPTKT